MVLCLKAWKSRSPPGIVACGSAEKPIHLSEGLPTGWPFWRLWSIAQGRNLLGAAGWSSPVARQAHNLKVVGSNPTPATKQIKGLAEKLAPCYLDLAQFWHSMT